MAPARALCPGLAARRHCTASCRPSSSTPWRRVRCQCPRAGPAVARFRFATCRLPASGRGLSPDSDSARAGARRAPPQAQAGPSCQWAPPGITIAAPGRKLQPRKIPGRIIMMVGPAAANATVEAAPGPANGPPVFSDVPQWACRWHYLSRLDPKLYCGVTASPHVAKRLPPQPPSRPQGRRRCPKSSAMPFGLRCQARRSPSIALAPCKYH
jgi:hypothetical protein